VKWIKHNLISESWAKKKLPRIHFVFHLAGQTCSYEARENPIGDLKANVLGLLHLLEYLKTQRNRPVVVIAGTATQAGQTQINPISEQTRDNPCTFYDISKLSAELYLKQYIREKWVKGCALRLGNVYGKSKKTQSKSRGVLDKIYNHAVSGKQISLFVNQKCKRDYIHLDDIISALIAAAKNNKKTNGQTFYIGSGCGTTIGEAFRLAIMLAALKTGRKVKIINKKPPKNFSEIENRNVIINSSRFKNATGWRPRFNFYTNMKLTYS